MEKFKKLLSMALALALVASASGCSGVGDSQAPSSPDTSPAISDDAGAGAMEETPEPEKKQYEYDNLQSIFIGIDEGTMLEDVLAFSTDLSLPHSVYTGNGIVKLIIAYTDGATKERYADSGDNLEVSFDVENDGKILYAQYANAGAPAYTAIYYNHGVWWDFRDNMAGDYSGYYIDDALSREDGVIVEYSNGNSKITHYFSCDSAEEAVQKVIDRVEE